MKIKVKELRQLISEAVLGNVTPDFMLNAMLDRTIDGVKQLLTKYILQNKSTDLEKRRAAQRSVDELLAGLRQDFKELLEARLSVFMDKM